ncbi:peptide N-acetyl-beta-D-glucosaminyl asparaginase amidase A-domain-containing protein [Dipodascopsis tothii]|uniref:peptide N-acetyl-beta-D-glucosaminyl asparaginase amidase A-domain-containing protein n=1 Tax=Dipodascopsis tothii TaxID=44089 RepID=UPI0034CECC39
MEKANAEPVAVAPAAGQRQNICVRAGDDAACARPADVSEKPADFDLDDQDVAGGYVVVVVDHEDARLLDGSRASRRKMRMQAAVKRLHSSMRTFMVAFVMLLLLSYHAHRSAEPDDHGAVGAPEPDRAGTDGVEPLEVIQVYTPPRAPGEAVAETEIMQHTFGFSYGRPFVGKYSPPDEKFTHVHWTLSTKSRGRQFDRLALMFLDDHEVWRTSTAEPTDNGIHFQYTKDMTPYLALLKKDRTFVFEMGNLVDDTYTGKFEMTLTATYFLAKSKDLDEDARPADGVVALSARRGSQGKPSHFSLPQDRAMTPIKLERDVVRAVAVIHASGNAAEEFWYTNAVNEYKDAFQDTRLPGHGPHREVQVWVGWKLAGVVFPYPVIFTGGIAPGLWRPIVGIGAYDVPSYEIDLTPFLPDLWAGARVELRVDSGQDAIDRDWIVSGNVLTWSREGAVGSGHITEYEVAPLRLTVNGTLGSDKTELNVTSTASRSLRVQSVLSFDDQESFEQHSWEQNMTSTNRQWYRGSGQRQQIWARTTGSDVGTLQTRVYDYPLEADSLYEFQPVFRIAAEVARGLSVQTSDDVDKQSDLWTHQSGHAYYIAQDPETHKGPYGGGATEQGYVDAAGEDYYWRTVRASNGRIVRDLEIGGDETGLKAAQRMVDPVVRAVATFDVPEFSLDVSKHVPASADVAAATARSGDAELPLVCGAAAGAASYDAQAACVRRILGRGPR